MDNPLAHFGVNMDFTFVFVFFALVWVRFLGLVATMPFLLGKPVPVPARVAFAALLAVSHTAWLLPAVRPLITENMLTLSLLFAKEAIFGIAMGTMIGLVFHIFESAGNMIDNQRGTAIARVLIPELGSMESQTAQFLFSLATVTYLALGGHHLFFQTVANSFEWLPVLVMPHIAPGWQPFLSHFAGMTANLLSASFAISAPVIIAILLADIILGIANRISPQMNVYELGFNIKGVIGVIVLTLMLSMLFDVMKAQFARSERDFAHGVKLMQGFGVTPPPWLALPGELPAPLPWLPPVH